MRLYRALNGLPAKCGGKQSPFVSGAQAGLVGMEELASMTKKELIWELMRGSAEKGYEAKMDGSVIL